MHIKWKYWLSQTCEVSLFFWAGFFFYFAIELLDCAFLILSLLFLVFGIVFHIKATPIQNEWYKQIRAKKVILKKCEGG